MKSNGLLKWLLIPAVLLVIFVGFKLFSGDRAKQPTTPGTADQPLTPDEVKTLGAEGDTSRDTLATLTAQIKQMRQELQAAVAENKQHKADNDRLKQRESTLDQRIQSAIDAERERQQKDHSQSASDQHETHELVRELKNRLDGMKGAASAADLPIGFGLEDSDTIAPDTRVEWSEPLDTLTKNGKVVTTRPPPPVRESAERTSFELPSDSQPLSDHADSSRDTSIRSASEGSAKPIYTVPANATLIGSVAMTALIGRVPIDGTVNDPYPFKVLVGPDNLTANGIDLPDVAGAVLSGTASGDWTLSCVRGQIRSITFVFNDGTIRTLPSSSGGGDSTGSGSILGGMGWISDPHGIPCVSGERRSNAQQYLSSQMLVTAAGAGAASLIKSDSGNTSFVTGSDGNVVGTVGISGAEAMGRVLASGVQDMSAWVNKLYGHAFAAIYVKPGAQVAVHIEKALNIDYDSAGRKVNHRLGGIHESEID